MASAFKVHGANIGQAMLDLLSVALNGGKIKIYDGAQPANPSVAVGAQVLLATVVCNADFAPAGVVVEGTDVTLTANAFTQDGDNDATGVAAWFRATKADDTVLLDGSAG